MIKINDQEIQTNFHGLNDVVKVYAGENLVLGQESPYKKATVSLDFFNVSGDKIQGNIGPGSVTIQNNQKIESYGMLTFDFMQGSEATISFSGISNISKVEFKMLYHNGIHSPQYGTTVSTGQLTDYQIDNYMLWTIEGDTGTIYFNNPNRDPDTKKYYTSIDWFSEITVYYTIG